MRWVHSIAGGRFVMKRSSIVRIGILSTWAVGLVSPALSEPPVCIPGAAGRFDVFADGDVDGDDHAILAACVSGPGKTPDPPRSIDPALCLQAFDVDGDRDVDIADARWFFQQYTGACRGIGDCPDGWHLLHRSGVIGVPDPDTFEASEAVVSDYTCELDETCRGVACSGQGACQGLNGKAVCACHRGYAGADCERCAVAYERDGKANCVLGPECRERLCSAQGTCRDAGLDIVCDCDQDTSGRFCEEGGGDPLTLRPPTRVVITGTDVSIPVGTCVRASAH